MAVAGSESIRGSKWPTRSMIELRRAVDAEVDAATRSEQREDHVLLVRGDIDAVLGDPDRLCKIVAGASRWLSVGRGLRGTVARRQPDA